MKTTKDIRVKLIGGDGNVFTIIGAVASALMRASFQAEAKEFKTKALNCGSYDDVLVLCMETVTVE